MTKDRYMDVVSELVEACVEYTFDIKQQLRFYGASVYKHEIVYVVNRKITNIRTILEFLKDKKTLDCVKRYSANQIVDGNQKISSSASGSFELKVEALVKEIIYGLDEFVEEVNSNPRFFAGRDFRRELRYQRKKLSSACRRGSRTRQMIQSI